jgi:hypothetical protein
VNGKRCRVTHPKLPADRGCDLPAGHDGDHEVQDSCGRAEYFWHPTHWAITGRDENGDLNGDVCRCSIGASHSWPDATS